MPLAKRRFYIQCREDECFKLYELLKDRIPSISQVSFEITSKGLIIEAYGYETDIKDLWYEIRKLVGSVKEIYKEKGLRKLDVKLVVRSIRKTFPPRLLVEILRRMNYFAEYQESSDILVTSASFEEVVKLAEKISDLNNQVSQIGATKTTRYYLIVASVLTGMSIDEVVKKSIEQGILEEVENGRYRVRKDWHEALDLFLKSTRS